jgi:hypothetical protein
VLRKFVSATDAGMIQLESYLGFANTKISTKWLRFVPPFSARIQVMYPIEVQCELVLASWHFVQRAVTTVSSPNLQFQSKLVLISAASCNDGFQFGYLVSSLRDVCGLQQGNFQYDGTKEGRANNSWVRYRGDLNIYYSEIVSLSLNGGANSQQLTRCVLFNNTFDNLRFAHSTRGLAFCTEQFDSLVFDKLRFAHDLTSRAHFAHGLISNLFLPAALAGS